MTVMIVFKLYIDKIDSVKHADFQSGNCNNTANINVKTSQYKKNL